MKKVSFHLALAVLCCLPLAGCAEREVHEAEAPLAVYSLSGESESLTLSNGVLVLTDTEQTLDGGDLDCHPAEPFTAVRYTKEIYLLSGGERRTLLSMGAQDNAGGMLEVSGDVGKVAGEIFTEEELAGLEADSLWLELICTDPYGAERVETLPLTLTEVARSGEDSALE